MCIKGILWEAEIRGYWGVKKFLFFNFYYKPYKTIWLLGVCAYFHVMKYKIKMKELK